MSLSRTNEIKVKVTIEPNVWFLRYYVVVSMNGSQLTDWAMTERAARRKATKFVRWYQADKNPVVIVDEVVP